MGLSTLATKEFWNQLFNYSNNCSLDNLNLTNSIENEPKKIFYLLNESESHLNTNNLHFLYNETGFLQENEISYLDKIKSLRKLIQDITNDIQLSFWCFFRDEPINIDNDLYLAMPLKENQNLIEILESCLGLYGKGDIL